MKRSRSAIWAAFFAVLANVSSGQSLGFTDHLAHGLDGAQTVCDTQSAIAAVLGVQRGVMDVCSLQRVVDPSGAAESPTRDHLDSPLVAVPATQRVVDEPELPVAPLAVMMLRAGADMLDAPPAPPLLWATSMPPESRYRYLLTSHAPPSRA